MPAEDRRLITRENLLARLDQAARRKVTIVSAPAGSGKSSLLRSWGDRLSGPGRLAAVQVQRDQRDARDFWLALLDAVLRASGGAVAPEPAAAPPPFSAAAMADRIVAALAATDVEVTLVIDDLHELNAPETLVEFSRLLANLPPSARAVLATRRDLPLHLHQLRLAGELAEIRAADLRFTERETRELLDASDIALSEAGIAQLHQRTEGWAAGLRLATLSLVGHPDPERFVAEFSGSHRTIADYLVTEMLEHQRAEVQDLLLRTCLLDRVNGELADLLTGRAGSERILLELEDRNAFVISLDPGRTWFRYHHLFADLLRLELRRRLPGQAPALHRMAAGWLDGHGHVAEAIRHTQQAGDWPDAARLLADHAFGLTMDGQAQTVRALLKAFPDDAAYPELSLVHAGRNLADGRLDEAAAHLAVAEKYAATTPADRQGRLRMAVASLKLSLAARDSRLAAVIEHAGGIQSPPKMYSGEDVALGTDLRAVALLNLGTVETSVGIGDAEGHLLQGVALARKIGRPYLEVRCLAQLGLALQDCRLTDAKARSREAIALAERHGWGAEWIIAPALVTLAAATAWTGEFDQGEHWLRRAAEVLRTDTGPDIGLLVKMVSGMLLAARGRHHEAAEDFAAADSLRSRLSSPHPFANQVTGWLLASQARAGNVRDAREALAALPGDQVSGEVRAAEAVICLADGDPVAALAALRGVLDATDPATGYTTVLEARLLAGLAHHELGDDGAANRAVERALELAEPDRLILPFVLSGSLDLLEALPKHATAHAALLTDILDILRGVPPAPDDAGAEPWVQQLSPAELKVLRYLPTNLSRPEIARELSVSANTVSTHIRNIYAKLGADARSAAVRQARELGLLSATGHR